MAIKKETEKGLVGGFILFSMLFTYIYFDSSSTTKESMSVLKNNLSFPTEEEVRPITFMEKQRDNIKKVLTNYYKMKIRKNYLCEHNTTCTDNLHVQTDEEIEYKDIQIAFNYNSVEAWTNERVDPLYCITVCSAIMIGITGANENLIEKTIFQYFDDAAKTQYGVKGNVLGIEVSIVPGYGGLLGCKFYKY